MDQDPEVSSWQEITEMREANEHSLVQDMARRIGEMMRRALAQAESINNQKNILEEELRQESELANTYDQLVAIEHEAANEEMKELLATHALLTDSEERMSNIASDLQDVRQKNSIAKYRSDQIAALLEEEKMLKRQLEERGVHIVFFPSQ